MEHTITLTDEQEAGAAFVAGGAENVDAMLQTFVSDQATSSWVPQRVVKENEALIEQVRDSPELFAQLQATIEEPVSAKRQSWATQLATAEGDAV